MEIKGLVEQTSTKDVTTKFGLKKTYSMKVGGEWISCGFKSPGVFTGDEVSCDAESTTYGLQTKAVAVLAKGSGGSASPSPIGALVGHSTRTTSYPIRQDKVFPVPALHGDRSIIRQNALSRATELFVAARSASKTTYEVEDEHVDFIVHLARKFEAYSAGDLDAVQAAKEVAEGNEALVKAAKAAAK